MSDAGRTFCPRCDAPNTGPSCKCGDTHISAGEFAAKKAAQHPEMTNRAIARKYGIPRATVNRARHSGGSNEPPETRTGLDGKEHPTQRKARPQAKRRREIPKDIEIGIAEAHLDEGHTLEAIAEAFGLDSVQPVKIAVAKEEGRREERADPEIDRGDLSPSAQKKLDAAIRQHEKRLDARFEERVQSEIQRRLKEMVYPRLQEKERDAARIIKSHRGVFKIAEYNTILFCLHPDRVPDNQQKAEAFQLWHENKVVLVSQKEDPKQYPGLPSLDEIMIRRGKVN